MQDNWYEAAVSAIAPHRIISVVDWASDAPVPSEPSPATYHVYKWGVNDPTEGSRSDNKENFDALASPVGWHALPYDNDPHFPAGHPKDPSLGFWRNTTTTWGNNVLAQENWQGQNYYIDNYRPDAGLRKHFEYVYDPKVTNKTEALDEAKKYIDNTVVQLFYTSNMVHDLYYRFVSTSTNYFTPTQPIPRTPDMASTRLLAISNSTISAVVELKVMLSSPTPRMVQDITMQTS